VLVLREDSLTDELVHRLGGDGLVVLDGNGAIADGDGVAEERVDRLHGADWQIDGLADRRIGGVNGSADPSIRQSANPT
jgi:hypothetical protein